MSKIQKTSLREIIARVEENHKWEGNILQKIAEEVVRYAIPVEEIIKNDLSLKLMKELDRKIKNKEIISMQINSLPRLGKSSLGILLGMFILELLKKYKMKPENVKFGMKNIARDQNEKIKKMRDPNLMYDIIVTDESNALEDTGENATVEKAQREVFSDVQAGRYIHGIWICPEGTMDKNSDIKLEIRNKSEGLIHTRVHYYMKSGLYYGWVLIGIADFNLKNLIRNWLNVEKRFFKYLKEKNESDRKYIEYWSKRDFYVEYMCKKYEKMELMNREGILHARDLDYAEIRKAVVTSLKPLAELNFISMQRLKNNIKSKIEIEFKKKKMPMSIIGREMEYERVLNYLEMYRSLTEIKVAIQNLANKVKRGKIGKIEFNKTMTILQNAREEMESEIKQSEEQLERLVSLNRKYNSHLEKTEERK